MMLQSSPTGPLLKVENLVVEYNVGGKTVHAWAFEGDLPRPFELKCNTFEIEWPPRSGNMKEFPEIDRAEFLAEEIARRKINPAQVPFLDRVRQALTGQSR